MPSISPTMVTHALNVSLEVRLVRKKKRKSTLNRIQVAKEKTKKLFKAGFIKEVQYPDWLSNVVMVKKAIGKWQMCVNFTDLNKACLKDSFLLPTIDRLKDASISHKVLSFMDAFSGYYQISINLIDQEKTTFITEDDLYCYRAMPFGLKNVGTTYQQIGRASCRERV